MCMVRHELKRSVGIDGTIKIMMIMMMILRRKKKYFCED